MTITAKYPGTCRKCGQSFAAGAQINWVKSEGSEHVTCPAQSAAPAPAANTVQRTWTGRSRHDGPEVGRVFRDRQTKDILVVVSVRSKYFAEDGLSFGLGADSGWAHYAACRPATDEEVRPLIEREAAAKARKEQQSRVQQIRDTIRKNGERPDGVNVVEGERLFDTCDIYGGGDWFAIGSDHIWYIRNNGMDGDDWSANNVRTGGAGAIGWRIPLDPTLAAELRSLAVSLEVKKC